ncbi:phenylalanine--tRNA ligase subunit beta [Aurantibacillus circumpalustris]|uniref:phenylalanine--tRNA ligase subunit beta n=1 Tax=Aurantibacillus circumpalustris TaxID=3036359 RepID=UPI00295C2FFD|nr:phenylalanine--tRNA ligase subunit beta [Aurantibacillus circumpalustris]
MKISNNWLKTIINSDITAEETAEKLTSAGLEVEGLEYIESIKGGLKGLVVGHVVECGKHPDADRLSVTKVDVGSGELLSIVCGAPNVAANQKVIVATIGTKLYPSEGEPFEIKKSKIRGVTSEGMICAEDEIGLGKSHAGIMILPENTIIGTPASEYFKMETDTVFEIGLTPNRSDAASHLGVARDLAAILNSHNNSHQYEVDIKGLHELDEASGLNGVEIIVENPEACERYSGLVITGVNVTESPDWLKTRLQSIGLRPINNIVDITNFVLHELGQPLHAFDLDKIKGKKVIVKTAKEGEKFKTLDGIERTLKSNDLMICNESEPMCIAGVFGGEKSGVTEKTKAIFLESAYFNPGYVRRTAKHHSLKTDASFRFERGTDPDITIKALVRAANLIFEIAGGTLSMEVKDLYPEKLWPYKVGFSYSNCTELIGKEIDRTIIKNIILNLGIGIDNEGSDGLLLLVPRYKTDVTREADVIEEVMRIYGYNNVEVSKNISYTAHNEAKNYDVDLDNRSGSLLEGFGFNEIMSLSLTKESYYTEENNTVKVVNPLSADLNVLRADMIYSGLEAIAYNINRKSSDLKFFELGKTYQQPKKEEAKYKEQKHLTLFVTGDLFQENPYGLKQKADFSFLKSTVVNLLNKCGVSSYKSVESTYANFDLGLTYQLNNKPFIELGQVSKALLKKFGISQPVFYTCINWEMLVKEFSKQDIKFQEISKFPTVRRDLALLIDKSVNYKQIEELAFSTERKLLKEVNLFDIFESEKLGNKKSYAVSFTLSNNEATLTDKQIDAVMDRLISGYKEKLGAELR